METHSPMLDIQEQSGITVITVNQVDLFSQTVITEIMDELYSTIDNAPQLQIVIDLANIKAIGSIMLGSLNALRRTIKDKDGRMALTSLAPAVRESFDISNLSSLFQIYDNVEDAVTGITG